MIFLLLSLLTIAIIVTMIGFFLTAKSQNRIQQPEFVVARRRSRSIDTEPLRRERRLEPVSSRNRRNVDSVPYTRRSAVDIAPSTRRHIDHPTAIARRNALTSMPISSNNLSIGHKYRTARYISATAVLEHMRWRRTGEPVPLSVIVIGLISIFILGIYALNFFLPHQVLISLLLFNLNTPAKTTNQPSNFPGITKSRASKST